VDVIDLYYQHRVDPNTPIEDTIVKNPRLRYGPLPTRRSRGFTH